MAHARRIVPALAAVCAAVLLLGWIFLPNDLCALGIHVVAAEAFLSNIKFSDEAGYFDTASHQKWMMCAWLLSVEWKFYWLLPVLLAAMRKLLPGTPAIAWPLLLGAAFSLAASILTTLAAKASSAKPRRKGAS